MLSSLVECLPFGIGALLALVLGHLKLPRTALAANFIGIGICVSWLAGEWTSGAFAAFLAVLLDSAGVALGWVTARLLGSLRHCRGRKY